MYSQSSISTIAVTCDVRIILFIFSLCIRRMYNKTRARGRGESFNAFPHRDVISHRARLYGLWVGVWVCMCVFYNNALPLHEIILYCVLLRVPYRGRSRVMFLAIIKTSPRIRYIIITILCNMYLGETISEEETTTAQTIDGHICGLLPAAFDGRAGGAVMAVRHARTHTRGQTTSSSSLTRVAGGFFFSFPDNFPVRARQR